MTREEFRDKKSKDYRKRRESYGIKDPVYLDEIEEAYYQGMVDADSNSHWISVKDRKPKLKYSDDTTKYSDTVIVTNGKYRTSACWLYSTLGGWYGWYDGDEELKGVTHWMLMPEAPKKGGEE